MLHSALQLMGVFHWLVGYQLGSVQFGSALFRTYSFPLQLVAITTKHSEKQHEQSALSWGKQLGIITIVSMDEIKGILFLILGLWLFEMCWSALSLNLRKTLKITIMTQSPCYNNNDRSFSLWGHIFISTIWLYYLCPLQKLLMINFIFIVPPTVKWNLRPWIQSLPFTLS